MKPEAIKQILFWLDVYDSRIHEGMLRYIRDKNANFAVVRYIGSGRFNLIGLVRDGAIVLTQMKEHIHARREILKKIRAPLILLSPADNAGQYSQILEDHYGAGQLAATYFLQRKFRRFAVACQNLDAGYTERIRGFEETLAKEGYPVHRIIYQEYSKDHTPPLGWAVFLIQNITQFKKPLAILALDDYMSISVARHCMMSGIRVPEDVAVLGIGNNHLICDYNATPLSSIDMNLDLLGWKAAELMHKLLEGRKPPETPLLIPPLGVVERRSTELLSAEDPRVVNSLRYIMDNLAASLNSKKVARFAGISSWQLDRLFVRAFGRTVKKELTRLRIQRISNLLAATHMSLKEIALASGFLTESHMIRVFIQANKISPTQYRDSLSASWKHNATAGIVQK